MKVTGKQDRGEERGMPMNHLVLAIAFNSGIFQLLSVLLLNHKDYQSFASLVLPAGSPGARYRPASGRGPYPSIHLPTFPPTHLLTYPSTHPLPSPSSCLAQFGTPGLRGRGRGAGSVGVASAGDRACAPEGLRGQEAGDTQGCGGGGAELVRAGTFGRPCPT